MQPLLVAARLSLSSLDHRTPAADCLRVAAEACAHISEVIQAARTLSLQLSPPLIREVGLGPALESLCRWVDDHHGLEIALKRAPDAEPEDEATRLLCFNAIRELLMNVVKHSGISLVSLTLERVEGEQLQVTVSDHGRGFDPAAIVSGSGLAGIRRRLGMIGGSLQIESRPGDGTVAMLLAPMQALRRDEWKFGTEDRRKDKDPDKEEPDAEDTHC
jgi:two-component system CheB/CheR fusion protein